MPNEIPKILQDKLHQNEVIPFVGAGISSGVKDKNGKELFLKWDDLLLSSVDILNDNNMLDEANYIKSSIKVAKTAESYLTIANSIKEYLSTQWKDFLNGNFNKDFDNIDENTLEIPKEVWNLGNLVITTNYDNVMSWSTDPKNLITWDKKDISGQVDSLKNLPTKNTLWHLHGRIDNLDDIVLTKESYESVYDQDSGSIEVLKYHMLTKSFIFLGFSLDDIYLREQLKKIQTLFAENSSPHFIVLKKGREPDLSEFGDIKPIYIEDYDEDYLRVLKKLSNFKNSDPRENNTAQVIEKIKEKEIIPFNVPFKSKEKGAIGIDEKLTEVHEKLTSSQKTSIGQKASFQGIGGLGKTQLAVEYAHKYKVCYTGVIWLTIDQSIDEQFLDLATKVFCLNEHIEAKEKIEIVKDKLFALKDALIILDNVDGKEEIKELYEKLSDNKILITSRNAIQGFSAIPLDTLNEENSLKLLISESCREIRDDELDSAKKICIELDGLPLALEMAGSYVEFSGLDWNEYYGLYMEDGISFLEESDIESCTKHEINISKTLSLSDSFLKDNPLIQKIIHLLAWSANEPMDKKLIAKMLDEKELKLSLPISLGNKLKFIKVSEDGYNLHRLVRDIWQKKEHLTDEFINSTASNLSSYMKKIKDEFLMLKELDKASLQAKRWAKVTNDKYLKASLINYSVYPDYHMGNYKIALENINEVYLLLEGDNTDIYAEVLNNKGVLMDYLGNSKEAKPYYEKALEIKKRLNKDADYSNIAESFINMGFNLESLGDLEEAKIYYKKALEMNKRLYKDIDHSNIAGSLNNMGVILRSLGDLEEAKIYYEKALEMNKRLYKDIDHPDIAGLLNNIGVVLRSLGDLEEAKTYYKKALEMNKRLYKDIDHPYIANSLNSMGTVLKFFGDLEEAKIYFEEAYLMNERKLTKNHPKTVLFMISYIRTLPIHILNKRNEAIRILKEFRIELQGNKKLLEQVNTEILRIEPKRKINNNSKRKKRK